MRRLLLLLPLLMIAADTPNEIEGWKVTMGEWKPNKAGFEGTGRIQYLASCPNFELTMVVQIKSWPQERGGFCISFGYTLPQDKPRYQLVLGESTPQCVSLSRLNVGEGNGILFARTDLSTPINKIGAIAIKLKHVNGIIEAQIGNKTILRGNDPTPLTGGTIRLSTNGQAICGKLKIKVISPPSPASDPGSR